MGQVNETGVKRPSATISWTLLALLPVVAFRPGAAAAQQIDDVTPPTLVDLSFTPTTLDTTSSSQQITFTIQASDDLSGVRDNNLGIRVTSPSGALGYQANGHIVS